MTPEDIHYLHPSEIRKAAIPMGRINLRPYVERRKSCSYSGTWR